MAAGYSDSAFIDLSKQSSIPETAQVTDMYISGTLSYNIGNTWMEIASSYSGKRYEAKLMKGYDCSFSSLRNSYEKVKTKWTIDYYTYANVI